ncbi:DNA mismatch repair protein MutL, partial [Dissostichus eleginoides]
VSGSLSGSLSTLMGLMVEKTRSGLRRERQKAIPTLTSQPPSPDPQSCDRRSGGHVSSPSQGSLGNYQHPSKGRCSCSSVAGAIITLPPLTSVPWARSPSGLSLSHHASLCQA